MRIVSDEWLEVAQKYCEHYDVGDGHCGELKRLKDGVPEWVKEVYVNQLKEWKRKGNSLPEDAGVYL